MTRPGYPSTRTLDELINALPVGSHRPFLEREASLTIDDAPITTVFIRPSIGAPLFG
jgi:hypothetical protein